MSCARLNVCALLVTACLLCVPNSWGQSSRSLSGKVFDQTGGVIGGSKITLYSDDRIRTLKAQDDGTFAVTPLPPGTRQLEVLSPGFLANRIRITDRTPEQVSFTLQIGTGNGSEFCKVREDLAKINGIEYLPVWITPSYEERPTRLQLTGVAVDAWGGPLARATVNVSRIDEDTPPDELRFIIGGYAKADRDFKRMIVAKATSNGRGEFAFANLQSGWYIVEVVHEGYYDARMTAFWIARQNLTKLSPVYLLPKSEAQPCSGRGL
jgi:Carboxypeptidase regulatory-like domain